MSDKADEEAARPRSPALSDTALETSRLLVELLHAAYAARNTQSAESADPGGGVGRMPGRLPPSITNHAVRAAIYVYQHGERTVGQIASGLGISYGWASRVVEELETAQYVVRSRDPQDRRIVHVRLEPSAVDLVERAFRWHGEAVEQALSPLSPECQQAVKTFLRRVIDLLGAGRPARA